MKTKLEELSAAFEAATPGEWGDLDGVVWGESCVTGSDESYLVCDLVGDLEHAVNEQDVFNGRFIAQAHNLMPQLLEAVELLEVAVNYGGLNEVGWDQGFALLEKLK